MVLDNASSGNIILDPAFSLGLVKTTPRTYTYDRSTTPQIEHVNETTVLIPAGSSKTRLLFKNVTAPVGVTFRPYGRMFFKIYGRYIYIYNANVTSLPTKDLVAVGVVKEGSANIFDDSGLNMYYKVTDDAGNVIKKWTTVGSGGSSSVGVGGYGWVYFDFPLLSDYWLKISAGPSGTADLYIDYIIFDRLEVTVYHDGSLARGEPVTCSFEVYDQDGVTQLALYEFNGVVSPYDFATHHYFASYRAGAKITYEVPIGIWALKSGAQGIFSRMRIDDLYVGDTKVTTNPEYYFNDLEVGFIHKDEYGNIVALPLAQAVENGVKKSDIPCDSLDEVLPDGHGGEARLVVTVNAKQIPEVLDKRIKMHTTLFIVM